MIPEGRVPPYNGDAEVAVLGSVLLDNEKWGEVFAIVNAEDFYVEAHKKIFECMYSLFEEGVPVDHVTLGGRLKSEGNFERVGGAMFLSSITDRVVTTANVEHYADIVREESAKRGVIYGAQAVIAEGMGTGGIGALSDSMEGLIHAANELSRRRMPGSLLSLGDRVRSNYEMVAGGYRGIALPWLSLDSMTAGLWPKTLTMFVARPNVGKSFVCVICARHAWMNGKRVLIVSPEMSKEEIAERFFVVHAGIDYHDVVLGQLPTKVENRFMQTISDNLGGENLWIMDSDDDLSPRGIESAIRACNPDLVAIDAIYDLRISGERRDRAIGALEWMKRNCKELGYAAIGFAQQNRKAELSESKGGGSRLGTIALADEIGQDAHAVFALEQTKDDKADKILKIKPMKLRRGQYKKSVVRVRWDFSVMEFSEIEDEGGDVDGEEIPF